jgi:hypothetical protein
MTALETQFGLLRAWRAMDFSKMHPRHAMTARHVPDALARAMPYAWTAETATAVVMASRTIPEETRLAWASLPKTFEAPMWWWFEKALPWQAGKRGGTLAARGLLIYLHCDSGRVVTNAEVTSDDYDVDGTASRRSAWSCRGKRRGRYRVSGRL